MKYSIALPLALSGILLTGCGDGLPSDKEILHAYNLAELTKEKHYETTWTFFEAMWPDPELEKSAGYAIEYTGVRTKDYIQNGEKLRVTLDATVQKSYLPYLNLAKRAMQDTYSSSDNADKAKLIYADLPSTLNFGRAIAEVSTHEMIGNYRKNTLERILRHSIRTDEELKQADDLLAQCASACSKYTNTHRGTIYHYLNNIVVKEYFLEGEFRSVPLYPFSVFEIYPKIVADDLPSSTFKK